MALTPTQRSLAHLRRLGYVAEVVEQHVPHARTTRDLFGFIDIVAVRGSDTVAVQTTTADHVAHRVVKIEASPHLDAVRAAGWRVVVHGWRPDGRLREIDITESSTTTTGST